MTHAHLKDTGVYSWKQTTVSPCGTHHVYESEPCYENRFASVLKFHNPGFAPVTDHTGSYHIDIKGNPLYAHRFIRTFGFYDGVAAVSSESGWFHILPSGDSPYEERYDWCGNFQEGLCPVRDKGGSYFHINQLGQRIYGSTYCYAGDFKDGIAVVCREDGKSSHIDKQGNYIHNKWYSQLDVFHKDFARAKDEQGWVHVTATGDPAYSKRFLSIEPFYNGQAHVEDGDGSLLIIDEDGQTIQAISKHQKNWVGELSGDFVGFWKSETIKLALELGILDKLPGSITEIETRSRVAGPNLLRLLRALWEIGIVEKQEEHWILTPKGRLLVPSEQSFMANACFMWFKVQKEWENLGSKFKSRETSHHPTLKEIETDEHLLKIYRNTLKGYAQEDFSDIARWSAWKEHKVICGLGQTAITVVTDILKANPLLHAIILNEDRPIYHVEFEDSLKPRLQQVFANPTTSCEVEADAILLPRFLHYFSDDDAYQILQNIHSALSDQGKLYIFEFVCDSTHPAGSLLDLNMLAESGGGLRTWHQWKTILGEVGFAIKDFQTLKPHLHLIVGGKE